MLPNWLYGKSKSKLAELLGGGGTPSDYNQVKAQVTQNTEDITLLNSAVDAKVDWDNFSEVGAVNCLENKGTTQVDAITGLTFTVNDDKSVTVSATSGTYPYTVPSAKAFTFNTDSCDNLKDGKVYRLSGCPSGGGSTSYYIAFYQSDVVDKSDQGNGYVFAKTASMTSVLTQISIKANAILSSAITFYPMITPASYNGPYVPYAKTNQELTDKSTLTTLSVTKNDSIVGSSFVVKARKQYNAVYISGYFNTAVAANRNDLLFTISGLTFLDANDHFYATIMSSTGVILFAEIFSDGTVKVSSETAMPTGYYIIDAVLLVE